MKQTNKWLRWSLVLSLGLGLFSSCAKDDILEQEKQTQAPERGQGLEFSTLGVDLSVDLEQEGGDEARLLTGVWMGRTGRDASENYPYLRIYNTPADFNAGATTLTDLQKQYFGVNSPEEVTQAILDKAPYYVGTSYVGGNMHEGHLILFNPDLGEQSVAVSRPIMMTGRMDGSRQYFIYDGEVTFARKSGDQAKKQTLLNTKEGWKVMVMMNTRSSVESRDPNTIWYLGMGRPLSGSGVTSVSTDNTSSEVTFTNSYNSAVGSPLPHFPAVPMASNWVDFTVNNGLDGGSNTIDKTEEHPSANGLKIKMQGALVQYDVVVNVSDQLDIRRWGLISNVFDTQGGYHIGPSTVALAYQSKDAGGYGVPGWQPAEVAYTTDPTQAQSYQFYRRATAFSGQAGESNPPFPYDLPALVTPYTSGRNLAAYGVVAEPVVIAGAHYAWRAFAPANQSGNLNATRFNPDRVLTPGVGNSYAGVLVSGTQRSPFVDRQNFQRFVFWGMPKAKKPAQPATYLFADVHNGRFPYRGASFNQAAFFKQDNYAAQPSLVLHQTNGYFKPGVVSHVQTTIEADLMITEVAKMVSYNDSDLYGMGANLQRTPNPNGSYDEIPLNYEYGGQQFPHYHGAIEITNLGARPAPLQDYAIVGLQYVKRANGWNVEYIKPGRTLNHWASTPPTTMDLKQAHYIPLSALSGRDRFRSNAGTPLALAFGRAYGATANSGVSRNGWTNVDRNRNNYELSFQQTMLVFTGKMALDFARYHREDMFTKHPYTAMAQEYTTNVNGNPFQGVLMGNEDHKVVHQNTHGYALVRVFPNGALRVIDSTLPIPGEQGWQSDGWGANPMPNTDANNRKMQDMENRNFTIERKPGINFPAIFPFRTDLGYDQQWEYTEYDYAQMLPGQKLTAGSIGVRHSTEKTIDALVDGRKGTTVVVSKNFIAILGEQINYTRTPAGDKNWWPGYYSRIPSQTQPK